MAVQSAAEFLGMELRHIEDAENQATEALKKMSGEVENDQLRQALDQRLQQGEKVLERVRRGLEKLDGKADSSGQNAAARGLIQEMQRAVREMGAPELKQAAMIGGVQKLEHYCIAAWGTVKGLAAGMGDQELARSMDEVIRDGYKLDEQLTKLAESEINPQAIEAGGGAGGRSGQGESASGQSGGNGSGGAGGGSSASSGTSSSGSGSSGSGSDDLKSREYMERKGK